MEFNILHKYFFSTYVGSYSIVTEDENHKSQITLTDKEAEITINYFGKGNILVGNVNNNRIKASKRFLLYPELTEIQLNLVFPKPNKNELRLYLSSEKFKPNPGQIWFIYYNNIKNGLVIGSLNEIEWRNIEQDDSTDEEYQRLIENTIVINDNSDLTEIGGKKKYQIGPHEVYKRDPKIAIERFNLENYKCENDPNHTTFLSNNTKKPFMEAHHFIPLKYQNFYDASLDTINNVFCLCPICHRLIHHATVDQKLQIINKLYNKRVCKLPRILGQIKV